jgi:dTDP-glucose 4,6-dehydratase
MLDILNITLLYPEQFLLADTEFILDVSDLENELRFKPQFHDKDMLLGAYKSYEVGF